MWRDLKETIVFKSLSNRVSLTHFIVRRSEITTNIYNELLEVRQRCSHPAVWRPPPGSRADSASGQ